MGLFFSLIVAMLFINFAMNSVDKKVDMQKKTDKLNEKHKKMKSDLIEKQTPVSIISNFFHNNNIRYWLSEDNKTFRVGFEMENEGVFDIYINIDNHYIIFNCAVLEDIKDEAVANTLDIVARINQFYNLGLLNFYFENRFIAFKNVLLLFENELTENKFKLYFDSTIDGARSCRPVVSKVVLDGEEPVIAMMSIGNK